MKSAGSLLIIAFLAVTTFAQDIQVNRQNKTIAVTADESVAADAEVAVLAIGYQNYGSSQDGAFRENVRAAEQITKAILDAKIPEANIETQKLNLGPPKSTRNGTRPRKENDNLRQSSPGISPCWRPKPKQSWIFA